MTYRDPLYKETWELPKIVEELSRTRELTRLRGIAQDVAPAAITTTPPVTSRFHHGLGVVFLAEIVLRNNPALASKRNLLLAAALLHDAGNPPFTHLGEIFLKSLNGKDGESFLEDIIHASETDHILDTHGVEPREMLDLVTGNAKPFSDILNGSLDIDNLDNIARYAFYAGYDHRAYDPIRIASAFRWTGSEWVLGAAVRDETRKWQKLRGEIYGANVYSPQQLAVIGMLHRAIGIALERGEIDERFFHLDDAEAVAHLLKCNQETTNLVSRALRWDRFEEAYRRETSEPLEDLVRFAADWKKQHALADRVADELDAPRGDVCVLCLKGVDKRRIRLAFVHEDGRREYDESEETPIYRLTASVPRIRLGERGKIRDIIEREIGS